MEYKIYNNDCLKQLDLIKENSIDSIVTDPPYELNFMGKGWDNAGISFQKETWEKCLKVLKPGGYLLAFGGSRTFHRIACAIEDAGFEIRDTIMWLYGSGFPKSMNIGLAIDKKNGVESKIIGQNQDILKKQAKDLREGYRKIVDSYNAGAIERNNGFKNVSADIKEAQNEWQGWGTCLKPSFEPIIVARKPFKGSLVDNVIQYGVGGINIDECRVGSNKEDINKLNKEWDREWNTSYKSYAENVGGSAGFDYSKARVENKGLTGRFPANTILTYDDIDFDEVCGGFPITGKESSSRYFYCAKASKKDRDEGLEYFEEKEMKVTNQYELPRDDGSVRNVHMRKNIHPTVKPTSLMQYLVRLVTPKGGIVLDPFMGSGSTGKAVMFENKERNTNYGFIGIEKETEYCNIAEARIKWANNYKEKRQEVNQITFDELKIEEE